MTTLTDNSLQGFMQMVAAKNGHEKEFLQAVEGGG